MQSAPLITWLANVRDLFRHNALYAFQSILGCDGVGHLLKLNSNGCKTGVSIGIRQALLRFRKTGIPCLIIEGLGTQKVVALKAKQVNLGDLIPRGKARCHGIGSISYAALIDKDRFAAIEDAVEVHVDDPQRDRDPQIADANAKQELVVCIGERREGGQERRSEKTGSTKRHEQMADDVVIDRKTLR